MASGGRDLPFPLVIFCLLLIRGYCPMPTASRVAGTNPVTPQRPLPPDTDYEDTTSPPVLAKTVPPVGDKPLKCAYSPCLENQIPCFDLAASTGCLCPGFTLFTVRPDTPNLKSVSWNGSEVVVQWCEPYSYVTGYVVTVGGQERRQFWNNQRSGAVGDIDDISEVCLLAVNDVGESDASCMTYQPRDTSLPLKAGLIGGALGFLLLLLLGVLLWRHKRQRKQEASISLQDAPGTQ